MGEEENAVTPFDDSGLVICAATGSNYHTQDKNLPAIYASSRGRSMAPEFRIASSSSFFTRFSPNSTYRRYSISA